MMLTQSRDDVKAIFDPLIVDIERLVADQVNLVTVKRMSEGYSKEDYVKVSRVEYICVDFTLILK
jgi:hypothetical protein